jgi:hypothetical protein
MEQPMDPESPSNASLIRYIYDAFGQGRVIDILGRLSPDIEWIAAENSPVGDKSPYRGVKEVYEGVFVRGGGEFFDLTVHVDELFDAGDKVVMLGFYTGTRKVAGKKIRAQAAHVWTVAAGRIVKFQQYTDTLQLAESAKSGSRTASPVYHRTAFSESGAAQSPSAPLQSRSAPLREPQ